MPFDPYSHFRPKSMKEEILTVPQHTAHLYAPGDLIDLSGRPRMVVVKRNFDYCNWTHTNELTIRKAAWLDTLRALRRGLWCRVKGWFS